MKNSRRYKNFRKKANKIINFSRLNAPVEKQIYEMNILKLKVFVMLQNILFVKDGISEKSPDSFNDKFHTSKLPQNHTTRLSSTYQLKVNNLKIERYGRESVVNKCTLDWNKH